MKKFILFLCLSVIFPYNVFAYSSEVILGGNTIGIDIKSTGVMIIGFYKVEGKYPNTDLKEGDIIKYVGSTKVDTIEDLTNAIEQNIKDNKITLTFIRKNKEKTTTIELVKVNNIYKTGLYVKDSITGIGTLTFIDPETKKYGALGHEILESNTKEIVEVKSGLIFKNTITSIDASSDGNPGSKNAKFYYNTKYGDINKNSKYGIYGSYQNNYDNNKLIEVASNDEIKIGKASLYTVLENEKIEAFDINITSINETSDTKNLTFEITDKKLLKKTGGIVQGMSGSPIVQNNKLIGAVTHVITDNVKTGYGIFITKMLEESDN